MAAQITCFIFALVSFFSLFVLCSLFYRNFEDEIKKAFKTDALVWNSQTKGEFLLICFGGHQGFINELSSVQITKYKKHVLIFRLLIAIYALSFFTSFAIGIL